ncbi:NUDIX hydrolase [Marinicella rhabdoformis]|uniref:NUDIX hydrolase n=1 Tax=Marinicella rhabdoformis TaxID=2580566 RepID=UPI0012AED8B4|nr:NUDIX hydrolase [Marinicella rhabdoformis]
MTPPSTPASSDVRDWLPRVTVATIVEDNGKFLMVEEDIYGVKTLNQPAGHLEPNESLAEAAVRETLEETGWHIKVDHLIEFSQWTSENSKNHYLRSCFAGTAIEFDPEQELDDGIIRAIWMTRDEVALEAHRLRSPLVLHHIDLHIKGKSTDLDVFSFYD